MLHTGRPRKRHWWAALGGIVAAALWACGEPEPSPPPEAAPPAAAAPGASPDAAFEPGAGAVIPAARVPDPGLPAGPAPRRRALWVLCEGSARVLEDPARIDALVADARALGATDLFVQVYRRGRAWYDATRADAAPHRAIAARTGVDTLRELIARAHAAGLRVHAWVNALSLADNREAPILGALGRTAAAVDQRGRSVLDYPDLDLPGPERRFLRMGTPAVWLDPGAPGVAEYLAGTFGELAARYPELDGLHLDYFRYPDVLPFSPGSRFGVGVHFGYGEGTRRRFREQTGLEPPFGDSLANANRWDDWRRDQLTRALRLIREAALAERPGLLVSAAVWPYPARGYLAVFQDWRRWLEDGLLDLAVPMLYSVDDRLFRQQVRALAGEPDARRIWIGVGSWLFASEPERARGQLELVRGAAVGGEALFSYDSIAASPALRAALSDDPGGES